VVIAQMQFPTLAQVRLLPGRFDDAVKTDLDYVLALKPGRLLAPFRREAGLPLTAQSYDNWESAGLDGHTAGHYLSALALLWAATGNHELQTRLQYMVAELAQCQAAIGTGYLGGVPDGAALFESLRHGGVTAARRLGSSEHWVPWYNLHKVFAGLIDAYRIAGVTQALDVVTKLADWWLGIAATIDDEAFEAMLDTEFGGMNEAFADLAEITGRADYLAMAHRFSHLAVLKPLQVGQDALTGRHANTQIPKAVGYAATGQVGDDATLKQAADFFWQTVTGQRTVAIGGNSVREHFHDPATFITMIDDREGPESCNTYNMLKLTRRLAESDFRPELLDYAEQAIFNHLLSAQHPTKGGFVYFTPMRPRHYRVYSTPNNCFWCCVGTGMEAQAQYGQWVFGIVDNALAVNLPIAAELHDARFGGVIRLETDFPNDDHLTLTFDLSEAKEFPVRLRVPGRTPGLTELAVNGEPITGTKAPGAVVVNRTWQPGDKLTYRLPLHLRAQRLPDGSPWEAYFAGPVLLAARAGTEHLSGLFADDSRWAHIAHDRLYPLSDLPILPGGTAAITQTGPLRYQITPVAGGESVELEPFADIHEARYTIYWPVADGDVAARQAELARLDSGIPLDNRTVDKVQFGEQQSESDHHFRGTATQAHTVGERHWRTTTEAIAVTLTDAENVGNALRVVVRLLTEPTAFDLRVAGQSLGVTELEAGDTFTELDFGIRPALVEADLPTQFEVELAAAHGRATPGIATIRLLKWAPV